MTSPCRVTHRAAGPLACSLRARRGQTVEPRVGLGALAHWAGGRATGPQSECAQRSPVEEAASPVPVEEAARTRQGSDTGSIVSVPSHCAGRPGQDKAGLKAARTRLRVAYKRW